MKIAIGGVCPISGNVADCNPSSITPSYSPLAAIDAALQHAKKLHSCVRRIIPLALRPNDSDAKKFGLTGAEVDVARPGYSFDVRTSIPWNPRSPRRRQIRKPHGEPTLVPLEQQSSHPRKCLPDN